MCDIDHCHIAGYINKENFCQINEIYNQDREKNLVLKKQTADLSQIDKFNARWSK